MHKLLKTISVSKNQGSMWSKFFAKYEKIAFHQGFDHLNSPKVPHNGCKGATKDTKPK
jgi:hypothetical protein